MKKSFNIKKVYSKPWAEIVNTRIECPILAGSPFGGNAGDVKIDEVSLVQAGRVRDAVADDLIDRGADRLGETHVAQA